MKLYFSAVKAVNKIKGRVFNIGGGISNSLSLLELFEILEQELECKLFYRELPWRKSDQKVFEADINRYQNLSGWYPQMNKIEGIKKMLAWVKQNA